MLTTSRIFCFIILAIFINLSDEIRTKRALLFPRATVLQFTYGISAPAILTTRSINLSLCFQVNYDLPYNITQFYMTRIIQAKQIQDDFDLSRENFYKYFINFLNSFGLKGHDCLYRLICELAEHPMSLEHKENLLEKIIHFIFTPSLEMVSNLNSTENFIFNLLQAEKFGQNQGECEQHYSGCFLSLATIFTSKYI